MRAQIWAALLVAIITILASSSSQAGMPAYTLADVPRVRTLSDLARMRLDVISFFLLALLVLAAIIQAIWNGLKKDFSRLPRLSYARSLGLVALWGLLFLLVLTMISGARELMTPGAWEKVGATYRLAPDPPPIETEISARFEAIQRLQVALWNGRSAGMYPARESLDGSLWIVPQHALAQYIYLGGANYPDDEEHHAAAPLPPALLAVEPDVVGRDRLALFRSGRIGWISGEEIERLSRPGEH
ncbi:MAG: hypothetical protein JWN86_3998 [Planctomycetota bacterium]|nr:hypothetical protein [Planctomycetota bacterium]